MQKENYSSLVKNYEKKVLLWFLFQVLKTPIRLDFSKLKNYCSNVEKEFIEIGDAGEKNHLLVGRFITDIKKPKIVKNKYSKK